MKKKGFARGLACACLALGMALAPAGPARAQASPEQKARAEALFRQAFALFQEGEFEAAALGFTQGLEIDPADGIGHFYLAETYARQNKTDLALRHYERTLALAPESKEALVARTRLLKRPPADPAARKESASILGMQVENLTPGSAREFGSKAKSGVLVVKIEEEYAAAGLARGDVILEVNQARVGNVVQFRAALKVDANQNNLFLVERKGTSFYTAIPGVKKP